MRLLAAREHSRVELEAKLKSRSFPLDEVGRVLDRLADEGLLSDARFAEAYVESRAGRGFGPLRIRMELRQRGVEDHLIESCLDERSEEWFDVLRAVHDRKYGESPPSDMKQRGQRFRFLQQRGFSPDQIRQLVWSD